MYEAHDALMCIGEKTYVNDANRTKLTNQHYYKSSDDMIELFKDLPEALENNFNLPFRCSFKPSSSKPILPNISSSDKDANELLNQLSKKGLEDKFINIFNIDYDKLENEEKYLKYKKRLDHEIRIIIEMNYAGYFLIVSDYIKWAKKNNIPVGPGRGWCWFLSSMVFVYN